MTKGIRGYGMKDRRRIRRMNHIKKDLRSPKYRIRRVEEEDGEKYKTKWYDVEGDD